MMLGLDAAASKYIVGLAGNPLLDKAMLCISFFGSLFLFLSVIVFLYFRGKKEESFLLAVSLAIDSLIALLFKSVVARPRPDLSNTNSFPSGHSSRIAMLATIVPQSYKFLRIPLIILTVLVMLSRVYLALHYPFDAIFGAVLGFVVAKIVYMHKGKILRLMF